MHIHVHLLILGIVPGVGAVDQFPTFFWEPRLFVLAWFSNPVFQEILNLEEKTAIWWRTLLFASGNSCKLVYPGQ